jgi:hypothetical protein
MDFTSRHRVSFVISKMNTIRSRDQQQKIQSILTQQSSQTHKIDQPTSQYEERVNKETMKPSSAQDKRIDLKVFATKQSKGVGGEKQKAPSWWQKITSRHSKSTPTAPGAFCTAIPRTKNHARELSAQGDKIDATWKVCDSKTYHDHSPLITQRRTRNVPKVGDEAMELSVAMARSRKLPGHWYFSNNIILVNKARCLRNTPALSRDMELDGIARAHAEIMAMTGIAAHSDPSTLRSKLSGPCRRIGENVAKGNSIKDIHTEIMESPKREADRNNLLDRRYTCMGIGTSKGHDGTLYMCQLFKG